VSSGLAGPTGIEPVTPGLRVRCSGLTELRALGWFLLVLLCVWVNNKFSLVGLSVGEERVFEGWNKSIVCENWSCVRATLSRPLY
jgi:hypothetical protein